MRGELRVLGDLPPRLRHGVFARGRSFPAWVRFAGPGPLAPADLDDNGVLSIAIKLMGVPGPKLIDDERFTQDFLGISAPTFTTPDVRANVRLRRQVGAGTPLSTSSTRTTRTCSSSSCRRCTPARRRARRSRTSAACRPARRGPGDAVLRAPAVQAPHADRALPVRRLPARGDAATLSREEVRLDFLVQTQTDPDRMPIENASVRRPEHLSPHVRVAELRLPVQRFDSPAQLAFADNLSFNPWHAIAEHRPLGNQHRARREIYLALSRARERMTAAPRIEPMGEKRFPERGGRPAPGAGARGEGRVAVSS